MGRLAHNNVRTSEVKHLTRSSIFILKLNPHQYGPPYLARTEQIFAATPLSGLADCRTLHLVCWLL